MPRLPVISGDEFTRIMRKTGYVWDHKVFDTAPSSALDDVTLRASLASHSAEGRLTRLQEKTLTLARPKALVSWSSGKDSAWALHVLRSQGEVELAGLLTTFNRAAGRVSMHAVREGLVEAQAAALGLPLVKVLIPSPCSNEEYEQAMGGAMERAKGDGITAVAFGDLFLEDVRRYREEKLAGTGIAPLFPLWRLDTSALARQMVTAGLRAYVTCVDPKQLAPSFVGRAYDERFLDDLPPGVDPCGERGEFHTFVYDGPMFSAPIPVTTGQVVSRDGFVFADVLPAGPLPPSRVAREG